MAVDTHLAQVSNTLVYSAMLVYTGALGAGVTDLALRGRARAAVSAARPAEELVAVGAPPTTPGAGAAAPAPGSPEYVVSTGRTRAGGVGRSLTWLALALHLGGVVARGLSAHRAPWGNMYEFSVAGSMVVTAVFLLLLTRRPELRYLSTFVVGPVLLTLGLAVTVFYTESAQLVPALHSFWLLIHVSIAFISSALFTMGFSSTVLQLVQDRREQARAAGNPPQRGRFMDALPSAAALERSAYSLTVAAFPLWSFTLIAGAIWAEAAWGRYWGWDPKETWSFITWVVYAAYLHARSTRGWDGRRAAWLALAGFGCLVFNFIGVNILFVGFHSYGGLKM